MSQSDPISETGFVVDYKTTNVAGWNAEVRDPRGKYCRIIAGDCIASDLTTNRKVASGTLPARVTLAFKGQLNGSWKTVQGSLWLDVHGMSRTVYKTP